MYPVDLHSHTVASSHAYSTIHDYVQVAKQKGIKLFANTDHGPEMTDSPHSWHFMNLVVLPRIVDGVAILRGIEANIKNRQGEIDCTKSMLDRLDFVVAGFHESVFAPANIEVHTEAMIATIESGLVQMISHPGNPRYSIDINAVAQAAARANVALEINNSSFVSSRLGSEGNCRKIAQAVKDAGGVLALGSDSHVAYTLGNFEHCQRILKEVDFPEERILNTSPRRFLDYLESHKGKTIVEFADL